MMRIFYGVSIALTLLLIGITFYFSSSIESVKSEMFGTFENIDWDSIADRCDSLTAKAGMFSLVIMIFYELLHVFTLMKLKTTSMKVLSIIGLVITAAMLGFSILMFAFPGQVYFDEVVLAWYAYAVLILGYSIIGLIQALSRKA